MVHIQSSLLTVEFVHVTLMIRLMESVFQLECLTVPLACVQSVFTVRLPLGPPWSWAGGTLVKCGDTRLP